MSQLILPARFKEQPRGAFEIAQANPLTRGLIGAFPLAGNFVDAIHGLDPSVVGSVPFGVPPSSGNASRWRAPNFNAGSLTFDPTKLAPQVSGNFSLSFWANIASQSRYNDIFVTSFGSGLYVQLGNGDIIVNIGDNTGTFLANFYVSPTGFGTNKWMHFVVTVAPTVCHVYFNGVDQGANAISGGIPVLIASGFTGAIGNESYHCDGAISNLLLYDRTLSKSDAVELYRNPQHVFRKQRRLFFGSGGASSFPLGLVKILGTSVQSANSLYQLLALLSHANGYSSESASLHQQVSLLSTALGNGTLEGSLSQLTEMVAAMDGNSLLRGSAISQLAALSSTMRGVGVETSALYQLLSLASKETGNSVTVASLLQDAFLASSAVGSSNAQGALAQTLALVSKLAGSSTLEASTLVFGFFLYSALRGSSTFTVNSLHQALSLLSEQEGSSSVAATLQQFFFLHSNATGEALLSASAKFVLGMLSSAEGTSLLLTSLHQNAPLNSGVVASTLLASAITQHAYIQSSLTGKSIESASLVNLLLVAARAEGISVEQATRLDQLAKMVSGLDGASALSAQMGFGVILEILSAINGGSKLLATKLDLSLLMSGKTVGYTTVSGALAQALKMASESENPSTLQAALQSLLLLEAQSTGYSEVEVTVELLTTLLHNFPTYYVVSLPNNEVWLVTADPYEDRVVSAPSNAPNVVTFLR